MIKSVCCFLLVFCVAGTASAQSSNWIGVRAGVNFANESFDSIPDGAAANMKLGPAIGVEFEHQFSDSWMLSTGLLFNQKGSNQKYDNTAVAQDLNGNDNFSLSYLEIPVLAKLLFGEGNLHPYVFAGPSFGMLLAASESADSKITAISDLKSQMSSLDIALDFGAGVTSDIGNGNSRWFFDVGYAAGLTSVFKSFSRADSDPNDRYINLSTAKSGDVRLAVGMLWQL